MEIGLFVAPQQGASYDDQLAAALRAEAAGFRSFVRSDHYLGFGVPGLPGPTDSWITLAGLARETTRITLGTMVSSATFRLPGPFAVTVAQVDAMSGGRVVLGIGTGWSEDEHHAYGIPFPPLGERFDRLTEQLQILTGMWTTPVGDHFSFEGRHYTVRDSPALPKPVQRPHPPIIIGGTGPRRTPALAAEFAHEYNVPPFEGLDATAAAFARGRRACEDRGRDPETMRRSVTLTTVCGTNDEDVRRRDDASPHQAAMAELHGRPEQIIEVLTRYADIGATHAYLRVLDLRDLEQIAVLGATVLPAFHAGHGVQSTS